VKRPPAFTYGLFLRQLNSSFRPVLGEDEIVAAAKVVSGAPPYPLRFLSAAAGSLLSVVLAALRIAGIGGAPAHLWIGGLWTAELTAIMPTFLASLIPAYFQRSMVVAVTREHVVVARQTAFRRRLTRVVVTPAISARIAATRRTRWTTTIVLDRPGTGPIRLNAIKSQRAELDQVLAAAYSAGVLVSTSATVSDQVSGTPADMQLPLVARLASGSRADPDVPR
jgi:hypothetical protein